MTPLVPTSLSTLSLEDLRAFLLDLLCQVAYREGDFTLSSGQTSPYYIDGKQVTLHPQGAIAVGRLLLPHLLPETVAVGGLTLGADPIVTAVNVVAAYENRAIASLIVRKQSKGHGTQAYIEGPPLPAQSCVAVVEDVVTTGQSALTAVERIRAAGYRVDQVLTLVDRQQGGDTLITQQGLTFQALFTIQDLQTHWATRQTL